MADISWGVFLHLCLTHLKARTTAIIFGLLPLAFAQLVYTTLSTPLASAAVYNQQYPMSQIAQRLNAPVAVNDLGLVALNSDNTCWTSSLATLKR